MKIKAIIILCALALLLAGTPRAFAGAKSVDPGDVMADILIVRPFCALATLFGSIGFVLSLPVAAASKSIPQTADALVIVPAHATFTRPLGDMQALTDYSEY